MLAGPFGYRGKLPDSSPHNDICGSLFVLTIFLGSFAIGKLLGY